MADSVQVDLEENSKHRVALDLTYKIAANEQPTQRNREYWLDLYARCRSVVVEGWSAEDALKP